MHIIAGAILTLVGAAAVAYIARGASAFEQEPPLLALGVMLVTMARMCALPRRISGAAHRDQRPAPIGWIVVTGWLTSGPASTDEGLVRYAQLLGFAVAAAVLAGVFLLVRRAPRRASFGPIDIVPVAGLAAALTLGMIWLRGNEAELRPCRLGNDLACQKIATRLIESAERSPSTRPTAWEARAALVLDTELCPAASEPGPCGGRRYAVGTVALRAGRLDAAKAAFRQACDFERSWCARAAKEQAVPWTPAEQARLERRARP
jgi:hypothetical protein